MASKHVISSNVNHVDQTFDYWLKRVMHFQNQWVYFGNKPHNQKMHKQVREALTLMGIENESIEAPMNHCLRITPMYKKQVLKSS